MQEIKTLIHTALVAEAKPIIRYLNLSLFEKDKFNIYKNEEVVLISSGIGEVKTKDALKYILKKIHPQICINFGIAGCVDKNIKLGSLFCTNNENLDISYGSLSSHNEVITSKNKIKTLLVDQEAKAFLSCTKDIEKIFVFKIVSDHLVNKIPTKAKLNQMIENSLKNWIIYGK